MSSPAWATEQFANAIAPATSCTSSIATTTLAANLNGTDATDNIALASPPWPSSGTFSIQIDSEIITINSCANGVCNATRNESGGEVSHTAGAYICGPVYTARMWNQLKADLMGVRLPFAIGAPTPSGTIAIPCADNITFPANFNGPAPSAQSVAVCDPLNRPTATNNYSITVGPTPLTINNVYGGVNNASGTITFTGLVVSAGQSIVVIQKGVNTSPAPPSDGTNTYTQTPITSDGCLDLAYSLNPTPGTYNLAVPAAAGNNAALVWLVSNLNSIDIVGGQAYTTGTTLAQSGVATPSVVNDTVIFGYYLEAASPGPSFGGQPASVNYSGTGSPVDQTLSTLGTVTSNTTQALGAVVETGTVANNIGVQRNFTGAASPAFCGAAIALLGKDASVGSVTLTNTCVPTFTTNGPGFTCNVGQALKLHEPSNASGGGIGITLAGHL